MKFDTDYIVEKVDPCDVDENYTRIEVYRYTSKDEKETVMILYVDDSIYSDHGGKQTTSVEFWQFLADYRALSSHVSYL